MRIFVSSTFQDLQPYRLAALRVLRQLGHEVVAMEDFVAADTAPLSLVLDKVARSELYIGIFAWRYGFIPTQEPPEPPPAVEGATYGKTSITHYEYLHAKEKGLDCLAFLLDESVPWPPHLVDGFSANDPNAPSNTDAIRALRAELQLNAVVSYFTNPNDLEARVGAAVTVAGMSKQVRLNLAGVGQVYNTVDDSAPEAGIRNAMSNAGLQRVLQIDLGATPWWSTRLYLTCVLAERLTDVRRILVVQGDTFVGLLPTRWIITTLLAQHPDLARVARRLERRRSVLPDLGREMDEVVALWHDAFENDVKTPEEQIRAVLTPDLLRRWFGDVMLQQPVQLPDLGRASVIDLLRILDYPSEFVPVVSQPDRASPPPATDGTAQASVQPIQVVDKSALNAQLAHSYVTELMERARLA